MISISPYAVVAGLSMYFLGGLLRSHMRCLSQEIDDFIDDLCSHRYESRTYQEPSKFNTNILPK